MVVALALFLALQGQEPVTPPTSPAPAAPCRVLLTEVKVDPSLYTRLELVVHSKKWYGSSNAALSGLAKKAWKLDADAVVEVNVRHQPSGFAWAAPRAEGIAVKWTEAGRAEASKLQGQCFDRDGK